MVAHMSGGRNTNGRARVARRRVALRNQLSQQGLRVVTWNCQGLSMFKLFLLFEITSAHVICLQETWLPKGGGMPDIPGYNVFEHRRAKGKRGGFATLVKKGLNVTRVVENDYAILTELQLPSGDRVAVVNAYMPPIASIKRKRLNDEAVQDAVSELVARVPHNIKLALCGDFNARTGTIQPGASINSTLPRVSTDQQVCARGKWLSEQWRMWGCAPLNGSWEDHTGAATCLHSNGSSVVDYICLRGDAGGFGVLLEEMGGLSDHRVLQCTVRVDGEVGEELHKTQEQQQVSYKWVGGTSVYNYADSAHKWQQWSGCDEFQQGLQCIIDQFGDNLDVCVREVENFMLREAVQVGVVRECTGRQYQNANKQCKQLAPWFDDACRSARQQFRVMRQQHGARSSESQSAFADYKRACKCAAAKFAMSLPDQLKYSPRQFWQLINTPAKQQSCIAAQQFAAHQQQLLNQLGDAESAQQHAAPLQMEPFTATEVAEVLAKHFRGAASSGISKVPSQLYQHLRGGAIGPLTELINKCTIQQQPPDSLKLTKLVALYKNKGSELDCNNYRGLAIMQPLNKLIMSLLNQRLAKYAEEKQLRAPVQAGFRQHYQLEDLVLIIQVLIQHANISQQCLSLAFIDLEKAYDSVSRVKLWQTLAQQCNIPEAFIQCIQNMYYNSAALVDGINSSECRVEASRGVKQGCPMSPLLFGIFFERVHQHLQQLQLSDSQYKEFLFAAIQLCILLFADDAVLIAQSACQMQKLVNSFSEFCDLSELRINTSKTCVMLVNHCGEVQVKGVKLKEVDTFSYLGLQIAKSAKAPTAILADRLFKSRVAFYKIITKAKLFKISNVRVRSQLVQSLAVQHLIFGCVIWCCMLPNQLTLGVARTGSAEHKRLVFECETHLRQMLRWAIKGRRDVRTGLLYLATGVPTVQVLALKRALRYAESIEQHTRLVSEFKDGVLLYRPKQIGLNYFHFWDQFTRDWQGDQLTTTAIYQQFSLCVANDLQSSARIRQNGLNTLAAGVLQFMFQPKLSAVDPELTSFGRQLVTSDSSFVLRMQQQEDGSYVEQLMLHNFPSWLQLGYQRTVQQFLQFWYGRNAVVRICPLCQQSVQHIVQHLLTTCNNISDAADSGQWKAASEIILRNNAALVIYAAFPLIFRTLDQLDTSIFGDYASAYQ